MAPTSEQNKAIMLVKQLDQIRYKFKINANFMYGVISFLQHMYSPRCGRSTTTWRRWTLNGSKIFIRTIGFKFNVT